MKNIKKWVLLVSRLKFHDTLATRQTQKDAQNGLMLLNIQRKLWKSKIKNSLHTTDILPRLCRYRSGARHDSARPCAAAVRDRISKRSAGVTQHGAVACHGNWRATEVLVRDKASHFAHILKAFHEEENCGFECFVAEEVSCGFENRFLKTLFEYLLMINVGLNGKLKFHIWQSQT